MSNGGARLELSELLSSPANHCFQAFSVLYLIFSLFFPEAKDHGLTIQENVTVVPVSVVTHILISYSKNDRQSSGIKMLNIYIWPVVSVI